MREYYGALVVGAGIAGIRSALDLAVSGQKVALIDRRPTHGGILSQLDYQFPSDHCGMCKMLPLLSRDSSSQYCLRKGLFHENIDILFSTELDRLEGDPGSFQATLRQHSTFVDPSRCISCGECAKVCPVRVPSEFNAGLTQRPAVHLPVPHAIPNHYVVDLDNCTRCWACHKACPTGAIDFKFEERKEFHVMVVSPDKALFDDLSQWLHDQNFPLRHAAGGQQAVEALADDAPCRLMVLDLAAADMDPERILARTLEMRPEAHVILLAEPGQEETAQALLAQGAKDLLVRPLDKDGLVGWLDKLYMRIASDRLIQMEVGSVILAGGFECYNPADPEHPRADVLGYGSVPGVVTAVEFERLCSSTGPTGGKLLRPDGRAAHRIAWLQCVGSRDLKLNADFCSSICCMFSIKEALLAKKLTHGTADTTIFYMDMRTFGKDFQRYRERAENQSGVRFTRARLHSVVPAPKGSQHLLRTEWVCDDGVTREEEFDLLVLATGVRPPRGTADLAKALEVETNPWGFVTTRPFQPSRTSRLGVFAAGAFDRPRDVAESVIQAGSAAMGASRLMHIYAAPTKEQAPPEPEYADVSRAPAKTMVALCTSCPTMERNIDVEPFLERLATLDSVDRAVAVQNACTAQGWQQIQGEAAEHKPNRLVIGACMPYSYVPKLRELGRAIGLSPSLMDVVDVYTPTVPGAVQTQAQVEREVHTTLAMSVARIKHANPLPPPTTVDVSRNALVVGGGVAGLSAALGIADHGYGVCLVEREEKLGGRAMNLHYTLDDEEPRRFMEDLVEQVRGHPKIRVLTDSRVVISMGHAGRFITAIASPDGALTLEHGVTLLATGARAVVPDSYGFMVHKSVLTQTQLEERIATGVLDTSQLASVAMIQCVESREEPRNYCSRVCCQGALKNILMLKRKNPDIRIYVFYRDMMSYGFHETFYTQARKAGAVFIRYDVDRKPQVRFDQGKPVITAPDPILGREVEVRADLLALSVGMEPNEPEELLEIFGVEVDKDGFYQEAESKWRPLDFMKQGVFMCGSAHAPKSMGEAIASAQAAAQRAMRILSAEKLIRERVVATVRHSLCSLCLSCVEACPYEARRMDMDLDRIVVDEILCQGCGSCAAVCPNSATVLDGFHDGQVMSVIDEALSAASVLPEPAPVE